MAKLLVGFYFVEPAVIKINILCGDWDQPRHILQRRNIILILSEIKSLYGGEAGVRQCYPIFITSYLVSNFSRICSY